jgi:hypothetical protein
MQTDFIKYAPGQTISCQSLSLNIKRLFKLDSDVLHNLYRPNRQVSYDDSQRLFKKSCIELFGINCKFENRRSKLRRKNQIHFHVKKCNRRAQ